MEQTIDLRPYLAALGRFLWLIVGALLLAGAVSIAIYLSSGNYEATTLLTIPEPVQQAEFDARLTSTVRPTQALTQYPELARSEELLSRLAVKAEALSAGRITTATQLRAMTKVTTSADNRLMRLIVTDKDPDLATQLANLWADEFIAVIERLYGRGGADYFNDQLAQADTALQTANDALVAFQATNRQGIVDNELAALIARQQSLLADVNRYEAVLADIATLRTQLENNTSDAVTLADQLAALTVQLRAFEESLATPVAPQFQLNIGADTQLSANYNNSTPCACPSRPPWPPAARNRRRWPRPSSPCRPRSSSSSTRGSASCARARSRRILMSSWRARSTRSAWPRARRSFAWPAAPWCPTSRRAPAWWRWCRCWPSSPSFPRSPSSSSGRGGAGRRAAPPVDRGQA